MNKSMMIKERKSRLSSRIGRNGRCYGVFDIQSED